MPVPAAIPPVLRTLNFMLGKNDGVRSTATTIARSTLGTVHPMELECSVVTAYVFHLRYEVLNKVRSTYHAAVNG